MIISDVLSAMFIAALALAAVAVPAAALVLTVAGAAQAAQRLGRGGWTW